MERGRTSIEEALFIKKGLRIKILALCKIQYPMKNHWQNRNTSEFQQTISNVLFAFFTKAY